MNLDSCERVLAQLDWFVGDDLDAAAATAVRSHLRECVSCRAEAGALQRTRNTLRAAAEAACRGVDEAMFAAMHDEVMAAVRDQEMRDAAPPSLLRRVLPFAAAGALFVVGWTVVRHWVPPSVFDREPIGTSVVAPRQAHPFGVPALPLRLLSDDSVEEPAADGLGAGMMGRWRLRTLEGVDATAPLLPPPVRREH
ncbi:MAG: zf-HC2 domain-containing protein [Planctomycetes bacterium]|nr:zf-HC2 domain-containing protein [Planctomycetota bacterium]